MYDRHPEKIIGLELIAVVEEKNYTVVSCHDYSLHTPFLLASHAHDVTLGNAERIRNVHPSSIFSCYIYFATRNIYTVTLITYSCPFTHYGIVHIRT